MVSRMVRRMPSKGYSFSVRNARVSFGGQRVKVVRMTTTTTTMTVIAMATVMTNRKGKTKVAGKIRVMVEQTTVTTRTSPRGTRKQAKTTKATRTATVVRTRLTKRMQARPCRQDHRFVSAILSTAPRTVMASGGTTFITVTLTAVWTNGSVWNASYPHRVSVTARRGLSRDKKKR